MHFPFFRVSLFFLEKGPVNFAIPASFPMERVGAEWEVLGARSKEGAEADYSWSRTKTP